MPDFSPLHAAATAPAIGRPPCPKCDTIMILARVTPDGAGYQYIFECPACDHLESEVVRFH
jgi:hypothetical protein